MGFFNKIANFAGPVGMIHPGIGGALGAGDNLAGAVDRLYSKRDGNSAGDQLQNDDYQLFIYNDNDSVYAANNQIIDGQASDFALKITADGLLTVKNLKILNFDLVAQIIRLINESNQLQSTVGSIDADIVGVKNDLITIQQELARQQHFRGYYLLNADTISLPDSADGDFAFKAESGTVWMYDTDWYNSGQVVPDQVTPASDAVPLVDSGSGVAGINTEYARGDHQHSLNVSEQIPLNDGGTGAAGTSTAYFRADHQHILSTDPTVANMPQKDTGTGNNGNLDYYARSNYAHPLNVDPIVANVPLVNATAAANGTSDFYSRNDHVHPQQLTYDGNVTASKFIKTGGLPIEILCANGDTTTIDSKFSRTYSIGAGGYIRLCVFPTRTSTGAPYRQFQVQCNTNAMQTIDLVPYYTVNGIIDLFGNITAPQYVQANYNIYYGAYQLQHTHTGSYSTAEYTAWISMMSGSGSVKVMEHVNFVSSLQCIVAGKRHCVVFIDIPLLDTNDKATAWGI
ncbi:MAG: hypothetical protein EZS28_016529 [Streblomastix strix]|uniref:Uncharacterized protein n=1 Tax=Streblomastix strix TaxID=222440 RepID=A0A5J4W0A2_9EUKA|nr:MAG: hypothetical protein EZS28_016529 [Streblomastix strix]